MKSIELEKRLFFHWELIMDKTKAPRTEHRYRYVIGPLSDSGLSGEPATNIEVIAFTSQKKAITIEDNSIPKGNFLLRIFELGFFLNFNIYMGE